MWAVRNVFLKSCWYHPWNIDVMLCILFLTFTDYYYYFFNEQQTVCVAAQRRPRMKFRRRATTADTCTGNCIMWRMNWVCWDLLVSQTWTNTTELCSKFRGWRVSSSTTSPHRAWKVPAWMAAPVRKRASMEIPPRSVVREDYHGGLCLLAGLWWSPPVVCRGTSLWCMGWPTGKTAPSAGSSPWWSPSLRVSLSHNLWRWVQFQFIIRH